MYYRTIASSDRLGKVGLGDVFTVDHLGPKAGLLGEVLVHRQDHVINELVDIPATHTQVIQVPLACWGVEEVPGKLAGAILCYELEYIILAELAIECVSPFVHVLRLIRCNGGPSPGLHHPPDIYSLTTCVHRGVSLVGCDLVPGNGILPLLRECLGNLVAVSLELPSSRASSDRRRRSPEDLVGVIGELVHDILVVAHAIGDVIDLRLKLRYLADSLGCSSTGSNLLLSLGQFLFVASQILAQAGVQLLFHLDPSTDHRECGVNPDALYPNSLKLTFKASHVSRVLNLRKLFTENLLLLRLGLLDLGLKLVESGRIQRQRLGGFNLRR